MAETTTSLLGKCKECDYAIFATREDVKLAENPSDVRGGAGVFRLNNGYVARCTNRHKFFQVKPIKGTYSESHKCDARCLNAKGWSCTCSCGGVNHGRGHAVIVVNAAELPKTSVAPGYEKSPLDLVAEAVKREQPAAPPLKHLGEPGQTIRGEVKVSRVINLADGVVLYVFLTTANGDRIKWFARPEFNPHFEVGATLTIRARVKAHSEFRGTPETLVIYVEEVE